MPILVLRLPRRHAPCLWSFVFKMLEIKRKVDAPWHHGGDVTGLVCWLEVFVSQHGELTQCCFAEQRFVCGVRCKTAVAVVLPRPGVHCRCVDVFSPFSLFSFLPVAVVKTKTPHPSSVFALLCLLCHHWTIVVHTTHVQGPTCCICLPIGGGCAGMQGSYSRNGEAGNINPPTPCGGSVRASASWWRE